MKSSLEENLIRRCCAGDIVSRSAARWPGKTALVFGDNRCTYMELNQRVNRCAHALLKLGLVRGDKAAILCHNCDQFVIYWFALMKIGAVMVPVNWAFKGREIEYVVNHSEARVLLCEDSLIDAVESIKDRLTTLETFFYVGLHGAKVPDGWIDFQSLLSAGHPSQEPEVEVYGDDAAVMIYTSGTESQPKGVINTHLNLEISLSVAVIDMRLFVGVVTLHGLPLFHMASLWKTLMTTALGGTSVIMYQPDPQKVLEITQKEKVNHWVWVTTLYATLLQIPNLREYDLSSLKTGVIFGSYISPKLLADWRELLPHFHLFSAYGQTECQLITVISDDAMTAKPGSVGRPMLITQLKIVDEEGVEVPAGQAGEIVIRSPNMMKGYFKEKEKTALTWQGGWHHTGDVGRLDEDGYLYFVDRIKDMIKTGGENVASTEVEEVIFNHPKIAEVAIFGLQHPIWQEAIAAAVAPKAGQMVAEEEIIAWCKERLAGFKVPKKVVVLETLPKSTTGKILKKDLRSLYADSFKGAE